MHQRRSASEGADNDASGLERCPRGTARIPSGTGLPSIDPVYSSIVALIYLEVSQGVSAHEIQETMAFPSSFTLI